MYSTFKGLLRNRTDFNKFKSGLYPYDDGDKEPDEYPCVVVQWEGEDSGPGGSFYKEYEFVYLSDLHPMLQ